MALPESVRQNLLAEFRKSLRHLAVVVAGLELVEEVFDHVGGVAGELVNP
jgi:Mg2+/Co2+ transporter CorC